MVNQEIIFSRIDEIIVRVHQYKVDPNFDEQVKERNSRKAPEKLSNDELLKVYATLVAFSQGANSSLVSNNLINSGVFEAAFQNFSVDKVSNMRVDEFLEKNWKMPLTYVRMKSKVGYIIEFAKKLKEDSSFSNLLTDSKIPKRLIKEEDIAAFWVAFNSLQSTMKERKIPYLRATTTLLHYLLDTGYDCIKPDSAVMNVAKRIGIIENEKGDANLRKVVSTLYQYALTRNLRPAIVDLYFLIEKPQEGARNYVHPKFYER